jgi:hypothetical protein
MPCENYREALTETAAADSEPSRELRSHLDACASCRAAFTEERQLFAAIDCGVRAATNAEVPHSFLPRVQASLEDVSASQRRWTPFLIFAAASTAIVLSAFIAMRPHLAAKNDQSKQVYSGPSHETPEVPVRREATETPAIAASNGFHHILRQRNSAPSNSVPSSGRMEVIVPPEERQAFARFVASMQERNDNALALVTSGPEKKEDPMSVAPLQIAKLEVRRLEGLESEVPDSTQENQ